MIENLFEIVRHKSDHNKLSSAIPKYSNYHRKFVTNNYGYYTQNFMSKICEQACMSCPQYRKTNAKKIFQQIIQKYMLNDLEIVFVGYFCKKNQWKLLPGVQIQDQNIDQSVYLENLLQLVSYFVKQYIGDIDQFQSICGEICNRDKYFLQKYKKWVLSNNPQLFTISPRQINQIYRQYTQGCQQLETKNDYNQMVDKIMDLSATYSMMTSLKNDKNAQHKKTANNHKKYPKNQLANISEIEQLEQLKYKTQKYGSKESIMKCLQSNSKINRNSKRQTPETEQLQKNQQKIYEDESERQRQRSRQKNPTKKRILLRGNYKKKQLPNNPVLDFIKQQKQYSQPQQNPNNSNIQGKSGRDLNRSFLDMNFKQNPNMSWMDLRWNHRSSRSQGLPMLWKPSQGGFFDKSYLG